jgi:hypothetical protein
MNCKESISDSGLLQKHGLISLEGLRQTADDLSEE